MAPHPDAARPSELPEGPRAICELMPQYFSNNVILNKVVTEAWRFEMLVYKLYLHDMRNAADPHSGLTSANLQRICARQKCASRGRVFAILGLMQIGGYLRRVRSAEDSRIVHLVPSGGFIEVVEGWNQRIFQIIDAIMPEGALAVRHMSEPRFGWDMRRKGRRSPPGGMEASRAFPRGRTLRGPRWPLDAVAELRGGDDPARRRRPYRAGRH